MATRKRTSHLKPRLYGKNKAGKPCSDSRNGRYGQACCPHAPPEQKTTPYKYATTTTPHILNIPSGKHKGKYHLMTCCQMCGDSMNAQAAANPAEFGKKYVARRLRNGSLVLKNPHTGKATQVVYPVNGARRQTKRRRR